MPIAIAGAGPLDVAAGHPAGLFGAGAGLGASIGNLFLPGSAFAGYPLGWATGGTTPGFLVIGAFAWHSPVTAAGGPGGSLTRWLTAATAPPPTPALTSPTTPLAVSFATVAPSGSPGPAAVVSATFPTALAVPAATPALYCGMMVGGPGFLGWAGNGIGAVSGAPPPHVYRTGGFPHIFGTTFPLVIVPGSHGVLIAGCFAEGATVPVELQSFSIE